jgi:hypothetical protein
MERLSLLQCCCPYGSSRYLPPPPSLYLALRMLYLGALNPHRLEGKGEGKGDEEGNTSSPLPLRPRRP